MEAERCSLFCCECDRDVEARLVWGDEVYPHRKDLQTLPFWQCDTCRNFVGCHHKTETPTKPLGCIPTKAIKRARQRIHAMLDPMWMNLPRKERQRARQSLYAQLSTVIGREYHTGDVRSVDEANRVLQALKSGGQHAGA